MQVVIAQRNILLELGVVLLQLRVVLLGLLVQLAQAAHLQQQWQFACDVIAKHRGALRLLRKQLDVRNLPYTSVSAGLAADVAAAPTQLCSCTNTGSKTKAQTKSSKRQSFALTGQERDRDLSVGFAAFLCYAHSHLHAHIAAELKELEAISCTTLSHLCGVFTNLFLGLSLLILQLAHEGC